jgi:hypothetical protein
MARRVPPSAVAETRSVTRVPAAKVEGCELCEAARFTPWFHEDDVCWIALCEVCDVPMVVWNGHGVEPPGHELDHMLEHLDRVATAQFGADGYSIDRVMRQIPDHFHAHARDPHWWSRRFGARP